MRKTALIVVGRCLEGEYDLSRLYAADFSTEESMAGWGQVLPVFLPETQVFNHAMAGRSTKTFLAEGRLQRLDGQLGEGDLLLIQFTHNDASDLVWRHTSPWTSFYHTLEIFVDTAMLHQARAVLLTPICLRSWQDGELQGSHGEYPNVIRALAAQRNVPLIDLYEKSLQAVREAGEEGSRKLYMHLEKGAYPGYPKGSQDNAHTQQAGAEKYALFVAEALKEYALV